MGLYAPIGQRFLHLGGLPASPKALNIPFHWASGSRAGTSVQDDVPLPQAPPSPSSSSSRTGRLCGFFAGDTAASTGPAARRGQEKVAERKRVGLLVRELHNRTWPRRSVPGGEPGADRVSRCAWVAEWVGAPCGLWAVGRSGLKALGVTGPLDKLSVGPGAAEAEAVGFPTRLALLGQEGSWSLDGAGWGWDILGGAFSCRVRAPVTRALGAQRVGLKMETGSGCGGVTVMGCRVPPG